MRARASSPTGMLGYAGRIVSRERVCKEPPVKHVDLVHARTEGDRGALRTVREGCAAGGGGTGGRVPHGEERVGTGGQQPARVRRPEEALVAGRNGLGQPSSRPRVDEPEPARRSRATVCASGASRDNAVVLLDGAGVLAQDELPAGARDGPGLEEPGAARGEEGPVVGGEGNGEKAATGGAAVYRWRRSPVWTSQTKAPPFGEAVARSRPLWENTTSCTGPL